MDMMLGDQVLEFKIRIAHLDAKSFYFIRPGDHTPVIVRKNDNWLVFELGSKQPFTGGVEIIAVYQREIFLHGLLYLFPGSGYSEILKSPLAGDIGKPASISIEKGYILDKIPVARTMILFLLIDKPSPLQLWIEFDLD